MKKDEYIIIIPSNYSYLDICENFIDILHIAWRNCPYKIVMSLFGEKKDFNRDVEVIDNGVDTTITRCVYNAARKYPGKMYLVFLPDAFFLRKIDQPDVERILNTLVKNKIDYCMLRPRKSYKSVKRLNDDIRYISKYDRYNHSFISFVATQSFINNEFFAEDYTDLKFEMKYLKEPKSMFDDVYYENHTILMKNFFHIRPGIEKGKWDRIVLSQLKHQYPEINFSNRMKLSIMDEIIIIIRDVVVKLFSNRTRIFCKRIFKKFLGNKMFVTKD